MNKTLLLLLIFLPGFSFAIDFDPPANAADPIKIVSVKQDGDLLSGYDHDGHGRVTLNSIFYVQMDPYREYIKYTGTTYTYTIWTDHSLELKSATSQFIRYNPEAYGPAEPMPSTKNLPHDFSVDEYQNLEKYLKAASPECPVTLELDQKTFLIKKVSQQCLANRS